MLADLFASMHRLIRNRKRVRFHWLPLFTAWYVLIIILKNWWGLVFQGGDEVGVSGWLFFYYAHLLFLFYLVVSAVLPDEIPESGLDLKEFYLENRLYLWGLLACVNFLLLLATLLRPVFTGDPFSWFPVVANTLMLGINLSLAFVRRILYHAVIVSLVFVLVVLEVYGSL